MDISPIDLTRQCHCRLTKGGRCEACRGLGVNTTVDELPLQCLSSMRSNSAIRRDKNLKVELKSSGFC
jgi:excinuclease UvrABC ATPase subunit